MFEYTELNGDTSMIEAKLKGDKLPIPKTSYKDLLRFSR
jgi:hypothetical protein